MKKKTGNSASPAPAAHFASAFRSIATESTAARVASGTNRNGTPHETLWTGLPSMRAPAETPTADGERVAVSDDGTKCWQRLRHPGKRQPGLVPLERYRCRSHTQLEDEPLLARTNRAFDREGKRAADGRVAGHRQFLAWREDAHPDVAAALGREDERRFGEGHLLGDALHLLGGQSLRLGEHRELIALEAAIGEDVEVEISEHMDERG